MVRVMVSLSNAYRVLRKRSQVMRLVDLHVNCAKPTGAQYLRYSLWSVCLSCFVNLTALR